MLLTRNNAMVFTMLLLWEHPARPAVPPLAEQLGRGAGGAGQVLRILRGSDGGGLVRTAALSTTHLPAIASPRSPYSEISAAVDRAAFMSLWRLPRRGRLHIDLDLFAHRLLAGMGAAVGQLRVHPATGTRVRGRVKDRPGPPPHGPCFPRPGRGEILRKVSAHVGDMSRCYERWLDNHPGAGGKIVVQWVISPDGKVRSARQVQSSFSDAEVPGCVLAIIRTWRFSRNKVGDVTVKMPFSFRAAEM